MFGSIMLGAGLLVIVGLVVASIRGGRSRSGSHGIYPGSVSSIGGSGFSGGGGDCGGGFSGGDCGGV
jgi:hypothetical protein